MKKRVIIFILGLAVVLSAGNVISQDENDFVRMRHAMMRDQIEARAIVDERVLDVMRKVPRHKFVPLAMRPFSYTDRPLPIGEDQTISQPYIVAVMTQALSLSGDEKVLEVGTGSGYQAAVLAELAKEVYTIEIIDALAKRSEKLLKEMGYKNITVKCGDGYKGWKEFAPYDAIIVTCAPPDVPDELFNQLKEGGKMVIPVGVTYQELIVVEKINGKMKKSGILPVRFVPMVEGEK